MNYFLTWVAACLGVAISCLLFDKGWQQIADAVFYMALGLWLHWLFHGRAEST